MDKNVGRGNLRGKMTDVAVVKVVIKSSKKVESKTRGRHKKRAGEICRMSISIDIVMEKLIQKLFSLKAFFYCTFQSYQLFSLVLTPRDF